MEAIANAAIPLLSENAKTELVERDWVVNFFDKARLTSDAQMRQLLAKILAGEANEPGHFSKRTINLVSELDKSDAEKFSIVCRFMVGIDSHLVPIYVLDAEFKDIYKNNGLTVEVINHVNAMGLIIWNDVGYSIDFGQPVSIVDYFGTKYSVQWDHESTKKTEVSVGRMLCTAAGEQLASICETKPVEGFMERIVTYWKSGGIDTKLQIAQPS